MGGRGGGRGVCVLDFGFLKWRENLMKEREEEELVSHVLIGGEGGEKKREEEENEVKKVYLLW